MENLQNGSQKYREKNPLVRAHVEQNFKEIIISSNCSLKLFWKVIWINFLPESVYICLKKQ